MLFFQRQRSQKAAAFFAVSFLLIGYQNCAPSGSFSTIDPQSVQSNHSSSEQPAPVPSPVPASEPQPVPAPAPAPQPQPQPPAPMPTPAPTPQPQPPAPMPTPVPAPQPQPQPQAPMPTPVPGQDSASHLYVATTGSDSNPGTKVAPLRTIPKASSLAKPNTIIHVAPGSYTGGFSTNKSGTADGPISYVSEVKWGAKLVPGSSGTIAWSNSGNYTTIRGFDLDGQTGSLWRIGFSLTGSYQTVQENRIHNIWGPSLPCDSNGGGAIVTDGYEYQHHHFILDNQIDSIGGGNPGTGCNVSGIYLQGETSIVKNNVIFNVTHTGIQAYHDANKAEIVNNTVFNCDRGIVLSANGLYHLKSAPDHFNVHNNLVYRNSGYGIVEAAGPLGIGQNNSYRNNLSFGNGNTNLVVSAGNQDSMSGNLAVDPQFVNYVATGGGDYRLKSTSSAIDKGLSSLAPNRDFSGAVRPQGASVDIGAFEFQGF